MFKEIFAQLRILNNNSAFGVGKGLTESSAPEVDLGNPELQKPAKVAIKIIAKTFVT